MNTMKRVSGMALAPVRDHGGGGDRDRLGTIQQRELDQLLDDDGLLMAAQPVIDLQTGEQVACEMLLRTRNPRLSRPDEVVDAAIRGGRLTELTRRIAEMVASAARRQPHLRLLMNLHPQDLADTGALVYCLRPLLDLHERVVFEITEAERLNSISAWSESVACLRRLGFALALDDLGEGYNSLALLPVVRPEVVKICRSIVHGMHRDPWRIELVSAVAAYCKRFGITTVAEGVEDIEDADRLKTTGVLWGQGYLFGRPEIIQ